MQSVTQHQFFITLINNMVTDIFTTINFFNGYNIKQVL